MAKPTGFSTPLVIAIMAFAIGGFIFMIDTAINPDATINTNKTVVTDPTPTNDTTSTKLAGNANVSVDDTTGDDAAE